jgi:hypothetical protein
MTKQEQYNLSFQKINTPEFNNYYDCNGDSSVEGSIGLALLLQSISKNEAGGLLEEVDLAISETGYEEDYVLDFDSSIWIDFIPPNAILHYSGGIVSYTVPLNDLKELLEEWITFVNN